jgi:hypothetical protein
MTTTTLAYDWTTDSTYKTMCFYWWATSSNLPHIYHTANKEFPLNLSWISVFQDPTRAREWIVDVISYTYFLDLIGTKIMYCLVASGLSLMWLPTLLWQDYRM